MENYTTEELTEALRAIDSVIHKCEKAQEKFPEGNSHHTLLRNRLKAMYISKALIGEALSKQEPATAPQLLSDDGGSPELLLSNLDQLHTTDLTDRNCHFGFFAVSGQNSVFPPNYDCFRTPNN